MAKTPSPGKPTTTAAEIVARAAALKGPVTPRLAINQAALSSRFAVSPMSAGQKARIAKMRKALGQ